MDCAMACPVTLLTGGLFYSQNGNIFLIYLRFYRLCHRFDYQKCKIAGFSNTFILKFLIILIFSPVCGQ